MSRLMIVLGAVWGFSFACCQGSEPTEVDQLSANEFFEKKIRPLLIQRCNECHSTEKADDSGRLALDNRTSLLAGGTRGSAVVAGKPEESLLIKAVQYVDPKLQMPPDGKLTEAEVALLSKWVLDGAHVPDYGKEIAKKQKEIDWNTARQFWSFVPSRRPDVPDMRNIVARNPIDAFVAAKLHEHQLLPAGEADRRTLIRRLSFDLLGLPPTPDNVDEFVADESPDAFERLVDRLLASPHFGERIARYWLDLARYADSTLDWQKNTDRAWMFRDWVTRAFNEDRPYDDFVRLQLAADMVSDVEPRDIAALGFLGVSPTYWKELRLAPSVIEVIVADEWDERLDTVSRTFLGMTVTCARCHDHKFDPVTTRDYYALAGVFASTQVADRPLLPLPLAEQLAEARLQFDKLQESLKKQEDKESEEAKKLQQQIDEIRSATPQIDVLMAPVVEEASVYVVADGPDATKLEYRKREPRNLPVFRRGNPSNPGDIVPRRFLELFAGRGDGETGSQIAGTEQHSIGVRSSELLVGRIFQQGSGRLELADAILNDAASLTGRVIVNRIWSYHFGKGLVRTPGDFGQQGDRPSHPELFEWLVNEFVEASANQVSSRTRVRWSLKHLHRLLVTSATYRQSSLYPAAGGSSRPVDTDNQLLSRMSRRRLDIESWRDAMLAVAGNLDDRMEGAGLELDLAANCRRTLYGRIGRDEQNDMLRIYDFPPPTMHSPSRDVTTTPLQQLFVFNSEFVERQSTQLAARLLDPIQISTHERVQRCYQLLFQRMPQAEEISMAERFLNSISTGTVGDQERWKIYVHSLLGLNEFIFID